MAWSIKLILLFGEISIDQFRYRHTTLLVSRRRRDNPSSIRQLKRILQHKTTLMEEEQLLHNNAVIPDAPQPAPPQHALPQHRAGDPSNLQPPPSPAVKWRARPRLALHGRCGPQGPWARAGRNAAFPGSQTTLTGISHQYRTASCQCNRGLLPCQCTSRAQTNQSKRRYRSTKHRYPYIFLNVISKNRRYRTARYRRRNVDIEVSSISGCVDIEVQNVDINEFSTLGYVDIEVYLQQYRYLKLRYRSCISYPISTS
jgi:hypothetical protein